MLLVDFIKMNFPRCRKCGTAFSLADSSLKSMLHRRCHSNDAVRLKPEDLRPRNCGICVFAMQPLVGQPTAILT